MAGKTAVIAIGGNSLIKNPLHQTVRDQYLAAHETTVHVASMIEQGWNVVVGHGNGPQVGFVLRRSELAAGELHEVPLDVCGADTQGAIGYALAQNLRNELDRRGLSRPVAAVVTQCEVAGDDQAFSNPSKPIGSFMDEAAAARRRQQDGWAVAEDASRGWRRVVASPRPERIVEMDAIKTLVDAGVVVIAVGGGGIPVVRNDAGDLEGVAAVIDKDLACSLLARNLGADLFLIATAVEKVALSFGTDEQRWVDKLTLAEAQHYLADGGHFAKGSMAPKIQSIIEFLEHSAGQALITDPEHIEPALLGRTGTWITVS
ncbi:MAG: carbamate kinase [Streptosporangiaceae bacterium]